tara:strand:+ start:159 stop:476 length:318 start_codon:yes stop_codon:yes gene_type:complete
MNIELKLDPDKDYTEQDIIKYITAYLFVESDEAASQILQPLGMLLGMHLDLVDHVPFNDIIWKLDKQLTKLQFMRKCKQRDIGVEKLRVIKKNHEDNKENNSRVG